MLAETGLLDGCSVTSHWGYADRFKSRFPNVKFQPEPDLVFADIEGHIVTAGGTSSWHDLAIHIISRHYNPGEAMRIAKVYLLKLHNEGQLPYATLVKNTLHKDAMVEQCEDWLRTHFQEQNAVSKLVSHMNVPERTLKRRFKKATGSTLIDHLQCLRIEEAKRILEQEAPPVDEVGYSVGYEDPSFFRRLFRRLTGLTPGQYKRMFRPLSATEMGSNRSSW